MAMWMLTKFAMIFFIMALAALLMSFVDIEREGLCNSQAARVTEAVSGALIQVINSPVEDERKVLPLESALSTGKSEFERYEIKIIDHESSTGDHEFRVEVDAANPQCGMGKAIPYDAGIILHFAGKNPIDDEGNPLEGILVEPSNSKSRSRYIIIIKCSEKNYPSRKYLFIEDCKQDDPMECLSLDSGQVDALCGWSEES